MYRFAEENLDKWIKEEIPTPILLRGARQVGKSYLANKIAEKNDLDLLILNFEENYKLKDFFTEDLNAQKILQKIELFFHKEIIKGKTLLFLDEIQQCPRALLAIRFLYEQVPGLHILAAGSLLEFLLKSSDISIPVGRIEYLFIQPMSFLEFLIARNNTAALKIIKNIDLNNPPDQTVHELLLEEFKLYMFLGGMPAVVNQYLETNDLLQSIRRQNILLNTYRDDFLKYSKKAQESSLHLVFDNIPGLLGRKFKYANISTDIRSSSLKDALDLLCHSGVVTKINKSKTAGMPLFAQVSEKDFKVNFLDIGLCYRMLGMNLDILENKDLHNVSSGGLAEQVVGQELLSYQDLNQKPRLVYWEKDGREISAELDFLYEYNGEIFGVEVKAGKTGTLKSLYQFMKKYNSRFGIRISQLPLSFENNILSVPFYAINSLNSLIMQCLKPI